ncbi:hypothetical protein BC936DRAFT_146134 [Jimgerdemannia flammicorona]|uniref:Protein kinase domain-containing protein n=1 Tax=Jimgerdemannia flammicorona TaxID=994334 RepID=A0A433D893_9FUNG|nr:hypothetical protein BC936DRAFT_146134 [Jimgerdemannia flammicorona]
MKIAIKSRPQSQQYTRTTRPSITGPIGGHAGPSMTILNDSSLRQQHQADTQRAAREWIESVLRMRLPSEDLHVALMDGVVLCRVINVLRPGMIQIIGTKDLPFVKMENISNFLLAAHELGLPNSELFQTVDLHEGKNMTAVAHTILALGRLAAGEYTSMSRRRVSQPENVARQMVDPAPRMSVDSPRTSSTDSFRRIMNPHIQAPDPPIPKSPQRSPSLAHRYLPSRFGFGGTNAEKDLEKGNDEMTVRVERNRSDTPPVLELSLNLLPPEPEQQFTERLTDILNQNQPGRTRLTDRESNRRVRNMPSAPSLGLSPSSEMDINATSNFTDYANSLSYGSQAPRIHRGGRMNPSHVPRERERDSENLPQYRHVRDIFASMKIDGEDPISRTASAPPVSLATQLSSPSRSTDIIQTAETLQNAFRSTRPASPTPDRPDEMSIGEAGDFLNLGRRRSIRSIAESIPESIPSIPDEDEFEDYDPHPTSNTNTNPNPPHPPSTPTTPSPTVRSSSSPAPPRTSAVNRNSGQRGAMVIQTDAPPRSTGTPSYPSTPTKSPTDSGYGTTGHRRPPSSGSSSSRPVTPERHEHSDRLDKSHSLSTTFPGKRTPARSRLPNHMRYQDKQQHEPPTPVPASSASTPIPSPSGSTPMSKAKKMGSMGKADGAQKERLVLTAEDGTVRAQYQLGACIGKGQFGAVYKALNLSTGEMVAVKRIKLEKNQVDEIDSLMQEVDLLKSLLHPNVVKYEGFVKSDGFFSIILELVENGSLLNTLKGFGNFPERLVASYCIKILEGLVFLHDNQVVHCDLKAANILTTKNANVKLSDFGVSLNLKLREADTGSVAGTPNWMAPEVIELKGASTKSDIWSLGCTIIELLTGKPPYSDLIPMSALFRIVEDERPPLPAKISDDLENFLILCFQKNPEDRPTARQLQEHDWITKNRVAKDNIPQLRRQTTAPEIKPLRDYDGSFGRGSMAYGHSNRSVGSLPLHDDQSYTYNDDEPVIPGTPPYPGNTPPTPSQFRDYPISFAGGTPPPRSNSASAQSVHSSHAGATPPRNNWFVHNGTPPRGAFNQSQQHVRASLSGDHFRPPLEHRFIKTSFAKAMECKLCSQPIKKNALFCEGCHLICHDRCKHNTRSCTVGSTYLQPLNDVTQSSPVLSPIYVPSPVPDSPPSTPRNSTSLSSRSRIRKASAEFYTSVAAQPPVPALPFVPQPSVSSSSSALIQRTRKISKVFSSVTSATLGNTLKDLATRNRSRELSDTMNLLRSQRHHPPSGSGPRPRSLHTTRLFRSP